MKLNIKTIALCAVMFIIALLLPVAPAAAEDEGSDVYAIDIEFGNLSFYYDYGIWNVNTMRYEASSSSQHNAEGTPAGFPGWYGFDGTTNYVSVTNHSADATVRVELTYRSLTDAEATSADADGVVTGVTMTVSGWGGNNWVDVPADGNAVVGYIHLQGEPKVNGQRYSSATMEPIGMFTLTITG